MGIMGENHGFSDHSMTSFWNSHHSHNPPHLTNSKPLHFRKAAISYTEGILPIPIFEKMSLSLSSTSKAPVEDNEFWSMLRPKYPPRKIIILLAWNLWQRGWSRMAGMKLPPMPTTISPICPIDTALLSRALPPERGYSWPMTNTSGCMNPSFYLNSLKALSYPQLEQYWTSSETVSTQAFYQRCCCLLVFVLCPY